MKYLLDTHIWIWAVSKPDKLSEEIKIISKDDSNELFISSISVWEFIVLVEKGKIIISKSIDEWIEEALIQSNIKIIPIDMEIAIKSRKINLSHQDPADRFIAATALVNQLTLITSDSKLAESNEISILFNRV